MRDIGLILVLALLVVVGVYAATGRPLPFIGNQDLNLDVNPPVIEPNAPLVNPNAPVEPQVNAPAETGSGGAPVVVTGRPLFTLEEPAGFLSGLLHGLLAPIMLVLGLFMAGVRMYDPINIGPIYDLGFLLGLLLVVAIPLFGRYRRWY